MEVTGISVYDLNFFRHSRSQHLEAEIAHLHKFHIIVDILCPHVLELVHCNVKPWFHVPIVVYDCSIIDLIHAYAWIVTEPKHMPRFVQWLRC